MALMRTIYYELDERGAVVAQPDPAVWTRWMMTHDRRIAQTQLGAVQVSTVFLGTDHGRYDSGPPVLFETMVVDEDNGEVEELTDRHTSSADAWVVHLVTVKRVLEQVPGGLTAGGKDKKLTDSGQDGELTDRGQFAVRPIYCWRVVSDGPPEEGLDLTGVADGCPAYASCEAALAPLRNALPEVAERVSEYWNLVDQNVGSLTYLLHAKLPGGFIYLARLVLPANPEWDQDRTE